MVLRSYWPALLWTLAIFILSAIPGSVIPEVKDFWDWLGPDKLVHLFFYGGYAFLWLRGFLKFSSQKPGLLAGLIVFSSGMVFGLLMEWLQYHYFIGRSGNLFDAAANVIGLVAGTASFYIFFRK